jgi:dihydrolipoamide dehydrogenase
VSGHHLRERQLSIRSLWQAVMVGETEGFAKVISDAGTTAVFRVHLIGP